jgi:hypothetical protein
MKKLRKLGENTIPCFGNREFSGLRTLVVYSVVNAGEVYFLAAIALKSMAPRLETETGTALTFASEGVL